MRFLTAALLVAAAVPCAAQEENNMQLVGFHDLQARSAYQPVIHKQGARWIAYIGHHGGKAVNPLTGAIELNGTSIVDVTDPRAPKQLAHIPGEAGEGERGGAQMVRVCDGATLPRADKSKVYLLRSFGNAAHEIWDVAIPAKPALVATVVKGLNGTHKSWWECDSGIAYLVSGGEGWRTRHMTKVYDLSDPAQPRFIRDFGLHGQQANARGPTPMQLHGMISAAPKRNRIYFAYGTSDPGILQIVDRDKLLNGAKEPTDENLRYPETMRLELPSVYGGHTSFPLLDMHGRDFVVLVYEELRNECERPRKMVWIVDVTTEAKPFGVASWTVPESSGDFCSRGGRFGAHASNENMTPIYYGRILFVSYFNAGVRALDVRDPFHPREIAYYIPAITDKTAKRCVGEATEQRCKIVIQTNNVEVDDRGYIYIVDRANTGLHILELAGEARNIANWEGVVR